MCSPQRKKAGKRRGRFFFLLVNTKKNIEGAQWETISVFFTSLPDVFPCGHFLAGVRRRQWKCGPTEPSLVYSGALDNLDLVFATEGKPGSGGQEEVGNGQELEVNWKESSPLADLAQGLGSEMDLNSEGLLSPAPCARLLLRVPLHTLPLQ